MHVASGGRFEERVGGTPQVDRRWLLIPRPLREPRQPVVPPAALVRDWVALPGLRVGRRFTGAGQVCRLLVAGWVDDGLDVPAGAEHELAGPAEELGGLVGAGPRDDVIGRAGHDV